MNISPFEPNMHAPVPLLRAPLLAGSPDVCHGFTTRHTQSGGRLDLGRAATPHAWSAVAAALGLPGASVARVDQVHGAVMHRVEGGGVAGAGDGLWTTQPGVVLAVRTADCVPVLLTIGAPVVAIAAVHAGWRGVAAEILPHAVACLRTVCPEGPLHAAVGPAISGRRYEVGEEVVEAIVSTGVPERVFVRRPPNAPRPFADVAAAARHQLALAGVASQEQLAVCTFDDPRMWSHRRHGAARGSLASVIALRHDR